MKFRWIIVAIALIAASAFALSVQGGRWWSVADVEIGPFGSRQCFGGECRPAGLGWVGGSERWMRTGVGTWAAGLISMFLLVILAGAVAARRVPKLVAKTTLVSIVTAALAGTWFVVQYPGVQGASADRGLWLFVVAVILGLVAAAGVLRAHRQAPT